MPPPQSAQLPPVLEHRGELTFALGHVGLLPGRIAAELRRGQMGWPCAAKGSTPGPSASRSAAVAGRMLELERTFVGPPERHMEATHPRWVVQIPASDPSPSPVGGTRAGRRSRRLETVSNGVPRCSAESGKTVAFPRVFVTPAEGRLHRSCVERR